VTDPSDRERPSAPPPAVPIPPAALERVVQVLTQRFAEDELTEEDLEARLEHVYAATTMAELRAVIADLPAPPATGAGVAVATARPERITALFSRQERQLTGVVPSALDIRARMGYVELDLSQAQLLPGVTVIDVRAFMGYAQIRLPAGVRVESYGRAIFGFFSLKGPGVSEADAAAPLVRITGRALFGYAECYAGARRRLERGR
jgi:hypothetical protein